MILRRVETICQLTNTRRRQRRHWIVLFSSFFPPLLFSFSFFFCCLPLPPSVHKHFFSQWRCSVYVCVSIEREREIVEDVKVRVCMCRGVCHPKPPSCFSFSCSLFLSLLVFLSGSLSLSFSSSVCCVCVIVSRLLSLLFVLCCTVGLAGRSGGSGGGGGHCCSLFSAYWRLVGRFLSLLSYDDDFDC